MSASESWGASESQGPGWWQAADGLWYPPQGAQVAAPPPPGPAFAPPSQYGAAPAYNQAMGYGANAPGGIVINGSPVASVGKRFGAYALDALLMNITFGIGWLIWAAFTAGNGQTPGKKLLNLRVYKRDSQSPATFGTMLGMRGIVGGFVFTLAVVFTLGVMAFMPFWDKANRTVVDAVSGTVVIDEATRA